MSEPGQACRKFTVEIAPGTTKNISILDPSAPTTDLIDAISKLVADHESSGSLDSPPVSTLFGTATKIHNVGTYFVHLYGSPMAVVSLNALSTVRQVHAWSEDGRLAISWLMRGNDQQETVEAPYFVEKAEGISQLSAVYAANKEYFDKELPRFTNEQEVWRCQLMLNLDRHRHLMQTLPIADLAAETSVQVHQEWNPLGASLSSL